MAANSNSGRLPIEKTYKLYIGGQFPRSESGRYFGLSDKEGKLLANISRGSRKDFRNATVAARKRQKPGRQTLPICVAKLSTVSPKC